MIRSFQLIVLIYLISGSDIIVGSVNGEPSRQDTVTSQSPHVKKIIKRYDIDLQTCVENFDIHKDKIIRTEDSRAMGAKYINEVDLGSREECLRMCCETNTCDVFVFEEKSPGSCYMFHCGSPDDFKCKFTKHRNYTSAVLAVSRQLSELEDQIRLTKHEQELSQLRKPEMVAVQNTVAPIVAPTSAPVTPLPPKETSSQGRACSRYQFECRSSGECIAIYNACDGIPQCADGSDEAPELDCPSPGTTPAPAAPTASKPASEARLPKLQGQRPGNAYPQPVNTYRMPPTSWNQPQYSGPDQGPVPGYNALQWSAYQQQQQQQQPQPSYRVPMAQFPVNPVHEYEDQNSHIFTHKGNGLVAESDSSANQYNEMPHEYNKYGNGGANNYYNNIPYRQPAQASWQQQPQNQPLAHDLNSLRGLEDMPQSQKVPSDGLSSPYSGPPIPPDYYYEDSQEARYHPLPAHEQELVQHVAVAHGERESIADGASPLQVKHQHHHKIVPAAESKQGAPTPERKGSIEVHVKEPELKKAADITTTSIPTLKATHEQHHMSHHKKRPEPEVSLEETGVIVEPIDGEVGKPSGAILSLSLGLCITVFMVILVACRLRMVRKRLRRGGKSPYAHDADYLVNGMYL